MEIDCQRAPQTLKGNIQHVVRVILRTFFRNAAREIKMFGKHHFNEFLKVKSDAHLISHSVLYLYLQPTGTKYRRLTQVDSKDSGERSRLKTILINAVLDK